MQYHTCGNQSAHDIMEFCSVNMDARYHRISVACDTMKFWIHYSLNSVGVVHSTWPSRAMQCGICMHQHSTCRRIRIRRWHSTYWHMAQCEGCWLTSLTACINDKIRDIRERNVTIRSEIWTTNIRSLGFRDIREWVILWGVDIMEFRVYMFASERGMGFMPYFLWASKGECGS